jgi:hypothetical protein
MCRATWTESGCESQAGPMELWPEPVLTRLARLSPSDHSECMLDHAGTILDQPSATHSTQSTC